MTSAVYLESDSLRESLLPRAKDAHKGNFGHVLVVGGDTGMAGAVRLAGEAALRAGAGRVTVATRPEHVAIVTSGRPEIMTHPIKNPETVVSLMASATLLLMGPGLGQSVWSVGVFEACIAFAMKQNMPIILDADALNLLAQSPRQYSNWLLTPHPGEAAHLLNQTTRAIQADRAEWVDALQKKYLGVAILKGQETLISDGAAPISLCPYGNPGMATAGMGDVLSGIVGGLCAQGLSLLEAAKCGVMIHALAGDAVAEKKGERGMIASDLFDELSVWLNPA